MRRSRRSRSGVSAVIVAVSLLALLGFAALVIDVAYGRYVAIELQNAADASAHAGVAQLDGTDDGVTAARDAAVMLAAANTAAGAAVTLDPNAANDPAGDVVLGIYDPTTGAFTASSDAVNTNAVRVRARLPELGLLVAPVALDRATVAVSSETMMYAEPGGGAGEVDCFIPFALPRCLIDLHTLAGLQTTTLKLNPPGIDNAGWGRPNASPNAAWSIDQITSCEASGSASVGEPIGLQNGSVNSAYQALADAVTGSDTSWDTAKWGALPARSGRSMVPAGSYGNTFEGVVMVFDGGPSYCQGSGGSFTGMSTIDGFMWGAVYDVVSGNANQRTVYLRLDPLTEHRVGTAGGGPDYGVTAPWSPPRLAGG